MTTETSCFLRRGENLPSAPSIRPYYSWRQCNDDLVFEFRCASPLPSLDQIRSRTKELFEDAQHNGRRTPKLTSIAFRDNSYTVLNSLRNLCSITT